MDVFGLVSPGWFFKFDNYIDLIFLNPVDVDGGQINFVIFCCLVWCSEVEICDRRVSLGFCFRLMIASALHLNGLRL